MMKWQPGVRHQGPGKTRQARFLRRQTTDAERKLWQLLRNRSLINHKFRRQVPLGPYFLDFYCAEKHTAIELDGGQHCEQAGLLHDIKRNGFLARHGILVLRYSDRDILLNSEGVIENLMTLLENPHPNPLLFKERKTKQNKPGW